MEFEGEYTLADTASDLRDVASALQIFSDEMPDEGDIQRYLDDMLTLADALELIESAYPDYARRSRRMEEDVDLLLASIDLTVVRLREMFQATRYRTFNGARPYRRAWDEFCRGLREEEGVTLGSRIDTYSLFVKNLLDTLGRKRVEQLAMADNRDRISRLLRRQEDADQASDISPIGPPSRPSRPAFPPAPPGIPAAWWDDWNQPSQPAAPSPPVHPLAYGAASPTLSNTTYSSTQTWSTNGSSSRQTAPGHWASSILTGRHPSTDFRTAGPPSRIYGRPDNGLLERLRSEDFYEVSRLSFEEDNITAGFWWRPDDHRARLLLSTTDQYGHPVSFCLPLTSLKLIRNGCMLKLCRLDRSAQPAPALVLWASLTFTVYERLVLFYSVFAAMKSQDHRKSPAKLSTFFHTRDKDEDQRFGGKIEDGGFLHALRVFRDRDSRGLRLEATACRGPMKKTPIWTAFITRDVRDPDWPLRTGPKTVSLAKLKYLFVFCDAYRPLKGRTGEVELKFTEKDDAADFMEVMRALRRAD